MQERSTSKTSTKVGTPGPLEEAMTRLARGDDASFARVYALAWSPIVRGLACATRNEALAEDIAQETFVKAWHGRGSYWAGAPVLPWLRTIARRTLIDFLRRARLEKLAARALAPSDVVESRMEERCDAKRAARATVLAMRQLPPKQAEAITVVANEGTTLCQLARRLGDSPLAVRLRVHRARAAIREALGELGKTFAPA